MNDLGHKLLVGNPTQIRARARSRHKSDKRDADLILDLLLKDEFPALCRRGVQGQSVLEQLRFRHALVKHHTRVCNRLQALAHAAGLPKRGIQTKRARAALMESNFTETQSFERDQLFEMLDDLSGRIKLIEGWLEEKAASDKRVELLLTHKGIGLLSALVVVHTSSDGQKYAVSVPSLNANYSFKYFGQEKGVSVYSFIDERHLLFYSTVISSSEREAAYVIDGLLHNETIKSDVHSTDSHGFTEVVFAITHLLGFTFAPRLKTLCKHQLYSFEKRKNYAARNCSILPDAYINTEIIAENWDSILRFVATIKLKRTSASQLFKRLNSYSNQHPLYQALKEFGKIIKTLFILKYVDDIELRQSIEKQLNKIEHSQRFAKSIAFGNNQEFSEGDKQMQDIIANCRRLIENMVICWNYLFLTQKLTESDNENEKQKLLETFKNSSIITWQHINFHGEYDFSEENTKDSIGFELPKILSWKPAKNGSQ